MESQTRGQVWLLLAFSSFILANMFDLSSTLVALKLGLAETNEALIILSSRLGENLVDVFVWLKVILFLGAGILTMVGVSTKSSLTKKLVVISFALFAGLIFLISLNNFLFIYSAL